MKKYFVKGSDKELHYGDTVSVDFTVENIRKLRELGIVELRDTPDEDENVYDKKKNEEEKEKLDFCSCGCNKTEGEDSDVDEEEIENFLDRLMDVFEIVVRKQNMQEKRIAALERDVNSKNCESNIEGIVAFLNGFIK